MTVFVVQEQGKFDYSTAEAYGDVRFITDMEYSDIASSPKNEKILKAIDDCVNDFDPDRDYLVLTGNPLMLGYAFHRFFGKAGYLRVLKFNRDSKRYKQLLFAPNRQVEVSYVPAR